MTVVYIILAVLIYIAIGGFFCGIIGDEDILLFAITFWPVMLVGELLMQLARLPYDLGEKIRKRRKKK